MPSIRPAIAFLAVLPLLLGAARLDAQQGDSTRAARLRADSLAARDSAARRDSTPRRTGDVLRLAPPRRDPLRLRTPSALGPLGTLQLQSPTGARLAESLADSLRGVASAQLDANFRRRSREWIGGAPPVAPAIVPDATARALPPGIATPEDPRLAVSTDPAAQAGAAQGRGAQAMDIFGDYADLGLQLNSRLEAKMERNRNERCSLSQSTIPGLNCAGRFQPQFDFQFNVRTGGVVADRIHVDVDYDSQREFDASNNISVYYEGKSDELIERLEVGNVFFNAPSSRFITGGIPSGNYGLQAKGQLGPMRFSTIVAQQKGNRVNGRTFIVGERTEQPAVTDLEDFRFEPRRFFFTVDPRELPGYPNIDILNGQAMRDAALSLGERQPVSVRVYRLNFRAPVVVPNGPRFRTLIDAPEGLPQGENPYELLRVGIDYYLDPSGLWLVLRQPLNLTDERLVVAYTVPAGRVPEVGGTPDEELQPNQSARLLYDYRVTPENAPAVFFKEIRSVYRLGGEDLKRESLQLQIGTGPGGTQQTPSPGTLSQTFLQMLRVSQSTNTAAFDAENRLWPRPGDPIASANGGQRLIRDQFVVFPSLRPFARQGDAGSPPTGRTGGLIEAASATANDTIYVTPGDRLIGTERPPAAFFIRANYLASGGGDFGSLMLGSVQLSRNSERLVVDGVLLRRDEDYEIDYDLGRVTFTRPDTLFRSPRQVTVQYEENPLFAAAPTSLFGLASQFPFRNGQVNFIAISQNQKTTFNRPPLGFEPASSLVAGVNGSFAFDAAPLTRLVERIPFVGPTSMSTVAVNAEMAMSRPQPNAAGVAYVESFEGESGFQLPISENAWYYSSIPTELSPALRQRLDLSATPEFDWRRAASLSWQNNGTINIPFQGQDGRTEYPQAQIYFQNVDPLFRAIGTNAYPEQVLWLSLYPRGVGGDFRRTDYRWRFDPAEQPDGHRWRSLRVGLSPTGVDLSRSEYLEFWTLVDTSRTAIGSGRNAKLVFDFGDISENSLAIVPETLVVKAPQPGDARIGLDSSAYWRGRQVQGFGRFDTERDSVSKGFDITRNDVGLPSDVVESVVVIDSLRGRAPAVAADVPYCTWSLDLAPFLGDTKPSCTRGNRRLDEEDVDGDFSLNDDNPNLETAWLNGARSAEQFSRYVVDLNDTTMYTRRGFGYPMTREHADGTAEELRMQWVLIRIPFQKPDEEVGAPTLRRVRSLRLTTISSSEQDTDFTPVTLMRMRLFGSPWLERQNQVVSRLVGAEAVPGTFQLTGTVGTQDSTARTPYQPPPGVVDAPETRQTGYENQLVQVNEKSIRISAGGAPQGMPLDARAEAYLRFPEGQKNFMGYRELHVWARGNGKGWDPLGGDLNFFVKIGRDPENFYLFRAEADTGQTINAWTDVRVQFEQLYRLRSIVQNDFLRGDSVGLASCRETGDLARFDIETPANPTWRPGIDAYVACRRTNEGVYAIYTKAPNISPPNLAQVQELAVGMVRVGDADPISSNDTLEVWADDIRLTKVVETPGYAGQFGIAVGAGDVGRLALNVSRKDANFRQLGEAPSYVTDDAMDLATNWQLDRFLPRALGYSIPFSMTYTRGGQDPFFLSQGDVRGDLIRGLRTPSSSAATYRMSLRRTQPLPQPLLGAVLDNLSVDAQFASGGGQSYNSVSHSSSYALDAGYALQAQPRAWAMPGLVRAALGRLPTWMQRTEAVRALRDSRLRWNPTTVRLQSGIARQVARNENYLLPAAGSVPGIGGILVPDTARIARSLNHVWRNTAGVELRPSGVIAATLNINSLRDMRRYGGELAQDTLDPSVPAAAERQRLLGMDVGLERERTMNAGVSFQPVVASWLRPRLDLSSAFTYTRDPNSRQLLRDSVTNELRLPRRFLNNRSITTGTSFDFSRMLGPVALKRRWLLRLVDVIEPIDISLTRLLSSSFDGTPFTPDASYQFAVGGLDDFLEQGGRLASSASQNSSVTMRGGLSLPLGLTLQSDARQSRDRTFYRTTSAVHQQRQTESTVLPRLSLGWNYRPTNATVMRVISNLGTSVGYEPTKQEAFSRGLPGSGAEDTTGRADRSVTKALGIPVRATITWSFLGDLTTGANWRHTTADERRPGSIVEGEATDFGIDVARNFPVPQKWNLSDQIHARASFQQSSNSRYLPNGATGRSYQANSGRTAFNLNADTQLAQNLTGSLVFSKVVNYDKLYDRRFSQLVVTAVMQLSFQAGDLR